MATLTVLQAAAARVTADPKAAALLIQQKLFPKLKPEVMVAAIEGLKNGVADRGRLSEPGVAALVAYAGEAAAGLDAKAGEGKFWTDTYWDQAAK